MVLIKINADALAVVVGCFPALSSCRILFKRGNNAVSVGSEIIFFDFKAQLARFFRVFEVRNQGFKLHALFTHLSHFDNNLCDKIRAVIKIVILPESGVTRGLNGERTVDALALEPELFVDNIAVSALIAVMNAAEEIVDEIGKTGRGNAVGNNGSALVALKRNN